MYSSFFGNVCLFCGRYDEVGYKVHGFWCCCECLADVADADAVELSDPEPTPEQIEEALNFIFDDEDAEASDEEIPFQEVK